MQFPQDKLVKLTKRLSLGVAVYGLWLGIASLQSGCGDETGKSTTGKRVTLHTRVDLAEVARGTFTNGFDWQIQLKEVELSIGELRYYEGAAIGVLPGDTSQRYAGAVPPPPKPRRACSVAGFRSLRQRPIRGTTSPVTSSGRCSRRPAWTCSSRRRV